MNEILITLSVFLLAGYSALMLFYYSGWRKTLPFNAERSSPKTKVSIVIASRNEEANIGKCIRSLLHQDYPVELFEIIVVDDDSEENPVLPASHAGEAGTDTLIYLSNPGTGKKSAIETGIKRATGDLIITTDADCVAEKKWLSAIVAYYEKFHPKMIAAPVTFANENSWLEKWQSLDLCGMMAITAGSIGNGFPNMCNGANLAYEKKVFEESGGFSGINAQPSGDDVMLMLKIAKKHPGGVHFLKSKEAIICTQPVKTFPELFHQRLRWLSKGTAFPDWRVSAVLAFSWLFNLSILTNFIIGIFRNEFLMTAAAAFVIKTMVELPLLSGGCAFLGKRKLLWNVLPAEVMHIFYVVIIGVLSRFSSYQWKGRTYPKSISLSS